MREITRVATPETEQELLTYPRSGSAVQLWNGAGRYARVPERTEIRLREALEGKRGDRDDGGEPGGQ